MAHRVFICHSSRDSATAFAACERLESHGIPCWIAPRDPVPGLPYGEQIVAAIEAATVVLLVFSTEANKSRAVLSEIELAANRDKIILPLRIADITPSGGLEYYIRSVHWHDAITPASDGHLESLVQRVEGLLDPTHAAPEPPPRVAAPAPRPHKPAAPTIAEADLNEAASRLAAHLGPIAKLLVRRHAQTASNLDALYDALAAEIADTTERSRFLATRRAGTR